jgi:hemoglobin-like flavoprotein
LVTDHPEYQKKFSSFADVPQEKLMKNGNFLAQAFTIMAGLNVVIQSLGSNELLAVQMAHLGKTHFERSITRGMFEQFARIIVDVMDDKLPLSDGEERAWENGLAALVTGISKSLKPKDEIVHPLTQLTPGQISDVKRSWANIREKRNTIVSKIFITLFSKNPKLQDKFSAFKNVPSSDLPSNAAFNEQVALVADRIDSMIEDLDKPLQMGGQIRYMAFSHIPREVRRQEFQDFNDELLVILGAKGVTSGDLESWKGVLSTMTRGIAKIQGI